MKTFFIEAKSSLDVRRCVEKAAGMLPKKTGIVTTAQHMHKLDDIKKSLEKKGIDAEIGGQVLGCDASAAAEIKDKVDAFLYVGSGEFHPIEIQLETGKRVVMANPFTDEARELDPKEAEKIIKRQRGGLAKFLSSEKIGIIVSTKPGQEKLKKAFELKKKIEKKGKKCFIFLGDTISPDELMNFSSIECWINTACPRFADQKKGVVNHGIIEENI